MTTDAWTVADPTPVPIAAGSVRRPSPSPEPNAAARPTAADVYRPRRLMSAPRPVEIIEGVAWAGCLSVLVSESGAGKTFVLLDRRRRGE